MIALRNGDCREILQNIPDGSVDLVVMDPPYEFGSVTGGGAFGTSNREYHGKLEPISHGLDPDLLESIVSKMRAVNAYIFCNKTQLRMYLDHFEGRGCNVDVLTWHKTNPTPTCNNKYLSDTEYVVYARDPGVRLYGTYELKRKFWVTPVNREDRDRYGHPTVKPLDIVSKLVSNSSQPGETVMDQFMGTGTTGVAAVRNGCSFIGIELSEQHFATAKARIEGAVNAVAMQRSLGSFAGVVE